MPAKKTPFWSEFVPVLPATVCPLIFAFVPVPEETAARKALGEYLHGHNRASLDAAKTYFGVILVFAAGAGLGSLVTEFTDIRAIWVCCGLLLISFILMFIRDDREA